MPAKKIAVSLSREALDLVDRYAAEPASDRELEALRREMSKTG